MTTRMRCALMISCLLVSVISNGVHAVELLTNGGLEPFGGEFPGWSLIETDENGSTTNSAEARGFADRGNDDNELGLWLRPWQGGGDAPSPLVNAVLSQTVPATAGEGYSFEGWSRWEINYAGGVETLDANSPLGDIPSPTRTEMELAFLDTGGSVIGTPHTLDLRTEQTNEGIYAPHRFDDIFGAGSPLVAPSGTASVRVSASMIDGAFNVDPEQSAFFDDFSLIAASSGSELLENGLLDEVAPEFFGWELIEFPDGVDTVNSAGFAQNPNTSGVVGAFLHPWANGGLDPNDAIFSQTVEGVAGGEYTASMWSRFETNFSGGVDTLDEASPNGAEDSPTETTLELAFLDSSGLEIGSPAVLDLKADRVAQGGNANDNQWYQHTIQATAPAGTEMVRITGAMIEGVFNIDPQQSAFFDDFSLDGPGLNGIDFNGDGLVDASDAPLLCDAIGDGDVSQQLADAGYSNGDFDLNGTVEFADFLTLSANFGRDGHFGQGDANCANGIEFGDFLILSSNFGKSAGGVEAIPEPAARFLMVFAMFFSAALRVQRRSN